MQDHTSHALKAARTLRKTMSLPEILLWQHLRGKPGGIKFRHQHPVLGYALDFYCASQRVAIEIDGIAHDMGNRPACDAKRDLALKDMGINVVRISAADVLHDAAAVADSIVRLCADRPPPSALQAATSPKRGGTNLPDNRPPPSALQAATSPKRGGTNLPDNRPPPSALRAAISPKRGGTNLPDNRPPPSALQAATSPKRGGVSSADLPDQSNSQISVPTPIATGAPQ